MKCRLNNSTITTKSCIKRQELALKLKSVDSESNKIKLLNKCRTCKRGRIIKKFPRKSFDNDVKKILKEQLIACAKSGCLILSEKGECTDIDLLLLLEMGVIQEINREILHVLGLNLALDGNRLKITKTKKQGGYILKRVNLAKKQSFNNLFSSYSRVRKEKTGFIIQPL